MKIPPAASSAESIFAFAMKFDAYKHHGGFEQAAEIASERRRDSLVAVQTELFMRARACRQTEEIDLLLEAYKELHPLFVKFADREGRPCPSP